MQSSFCSKNILEGDYMSVLFMTSTDKHYPEYKQTHSQGGKSFDCHRHTLLFLISPSFYSKNFDLQ